MISSISFSDTWWLYIVPSFWQSSLIALLALIMVWALRKRSAAFLYAILAVALVKFMVPPIVPAPVLAQPTMQTQPAAERPIADEAIAPPPFELSEAVVPIADGDVPMSPVATPESSVAIADAHIQAITVDSPGTTMPVAVPQAAVASNIAGRPGLAHALGRHWKEGLALVHGLGVLLVCAAMARALLRLRRFLRDTQPAGDELRALMEDISTQMNMQQRVELLVTPDTCAPMATGVLKRRIVLPEALCALDDDALRAVIAHELAHHRRWDLVFVWLEHMVAAVWWFNPLVWLLIRALHRKREDCCDDIVLKMGLAENGEYCSTLLRAAKCLRTSRTPVLAFGCANRLHPLGQRLTRIMDRAVRRRAALTVSGLAGIAVVSLCVLPTFLPVAAAPDEGGTAVQSEVDIEPATSQQKAESTSTAANPATEPPRIVSTSPEIGTQDVDPATAEIRITFDQDMREQTEHVLVWVTQGRPSQLRQGESKWVDKRTFVQAVHLEPGTFVLADIAEDYVRGENGVATVGGQLYFVTSGADASELAKIERPKVVSLMPDNAASNVVPGPTTLVIRFDRPMSSVFSVSKSFVVLDADYPVILGDSKWNDSKTCILPVNLKPGTQYKLGLNSADSNGFRSEPGVALEPVVWSFSTSGASAPMPDQAAAVVSPVSDPAVRIEEEIKEHYAKCDPEIQDYIRWTAKTFGPSGLWYADDAFAQQIPDEREHAITRNVDVLQGEYGRHLCKALAESGALKDTRLLPGLIKAASYHKEDSDYDCRPKWMAVAALGRQDDISAVPTLIPLVDHGNENTRKWARASLVRLTGEDFAADKQAWGKWWNESGHEPKIDLSQLKPWTPPKPPESQPSASAPPPVGTGPTGKVLQFDGKDDYVVIPPTAPLDLKETLSVSAWVRVDPGCSTIQAAVFRRADKRPGLEPYELGVYGGMMNFVMYVREGLSHSQSPTAFAGYDTNWHHWCGVRDAIAGVIRLYKDGKLANEVPAREGVSYDTETMGNEIGAIDQGHWSRGTNLGFLKGAVDQLAVWNVARGADDIAREVKEGLKGDEPGLVALWKFDEDGQEIIDSSPSKISATLGSTSSEDTNDPQRVGAQEALSQAGPAAGATPVVGEAVVPPESQAVVDALPGELVVKTTYHHRSRGGDYPVPSTVWMKKNGGEIIAAEYMPMMNRTCVAYATNAGVVRQYVNHSHGSDGREPSTSTMTIDAGNVTVTHDGGEKDGQTETYTVPPQNAYQPNSRPDPYIAHMALALVSLPQQDAELACFDWDNSGKGMATYDTKVEYMGKETVTLPAGTFEAQHFVETQTTFGDTWFKKRPGHVTEYWILDNGVMARILRHREPYELLLAGVEAPNELPGAIVQK